MQQNLHNESESEYDKIHDPAKIPTSPNGQGDITSRSKQEWDLDNITKSSGNLLTKASNMGMKAFTLGTEYATKASRSDLVKSATSMLNDTYSSLVNGSPTHPTNGPSPYMQGQKIPTIDDRTIDLRYSNTNKLSKLRRPYDPLTNTFTDSDSVDDKFLGSFYGSAEERDAEAEAYLRGDRWYWSMKTDEGKYEFARMEHTLDELTNKNRREDDGFEIAYVQNDQEEVQEFLNTLEKAKISTTRSNSHDSRTKDTTVEMKRDKSGSPFSARASRFLAGEPRSELSD
ncbi:uncharacterized protein L199_002699 [Kwoniella botswanensis]|uniref:uncharacterized protein n=1 Tax=Kwoniella botswanensis TaxID=1268659 RepID=UPI00315CDA09